jgi:hypothetical protein
LFTKPHAAIVPLPEYGHVETRHFLDAILELPDSEWTLRGLQQVAQNLGVPYKKLFHLFRMAVIDNTAGPPVMELIEFFGVAECRKRIEVQSKLLEYETDSNKRLKNEEQIGFNCRNNGS